MDPLSLDTLGILEGTDKTSLEQDCLRHYQRIKTLLETPALIFVES